MTICATPIGNLEDASPRLKAALASADIVYAEDTRRSRVLLDALGVSTPLRSYFVGNEEERSAELADRLRAGEDVALITDAGMPAVSDPGLTAVRAAAEVGAGVSVVPGPSAVTSALAVSGLPGERFAFEGFLPRKGSARERRLEELAAEVRTVVLFASPHRLPDDLEDLREVLGDDRQVVVARELTKLHEQVWRGTLAGAAEQFAAGAKGEVTLVIEGGMPAAPDLDAALRAVAEEVATDVPLSEAVRRVAELTGMKKRRLYEAALAQRSGQ